MLYWVKFIYEKFSLESGISTPKSSNGFIYNDRNGNDYHKKIITPGYTYYDKPVKKIKKTVRFEKK